MKYLIITGNPKQDGLCHAVTEEAKKGAEAGGAIVDMRKALNAFLTVYAVVSLI